MKHGLNGYTNYGCRCPECRAGQAAQMASWRARHANLPVEQIPHGASGYTNYRCRCDVCRVAHTAYRLRWPRKRVDEGGSV